MEKRTNNKYERDGLEEHEHHVGIDEGEHRDTQYGRDGPVDYWKYTFMMVVTEMMKINAKKAVTKGVKERKIRFPNRIDPEPVEMNPWITEDEV